MKQNWILWLLVILFLVSEILLFSANRQKNKATNLLREAKDQIVQLQAQVDQLTSSNADAQTAEIAQLRAENMDLPKLRAQVVQLQTQNQKLQQQMQSTLVTAQKQQQQLQEIQQERLAAEQQAEADAERDQCINNLRQIDAAKQQWALENGRSANAVPTEQDLLPYFKNNVMPTCPSGGTYTIGAVGVLPTCSVPGHVLPQVPSQ